MLTVLVKVIPEMRLDRETLPPHYRQNFFAFLVDYVFFGVALGFINLSSVVPAFVRRLTDSEPLVGLTSTLFGGGFQLPQLVFAHYVGNKPRKKPYMMLGTLGRVVFWVFALALWAGLGRYPGVMLALFFVGMASFAVCDSLVTVVWFDLLARAIPTQRRGRLIGLAQVIGGLAAIGVGAAVSAILARSYADPLAGYAWLFFLAGVALLPSTLGLAAIRELPSSEPAAVTDERRSGSARIVWRNPAFRRLVLCRLLLSGVDLATPFYVGHAQEVLHLPTRVIGGFVIAQTVGSITGSIVWGWLSERRGSLAVIRLVSLLAPLAPIIALAAHLGNQGWLIAVYPLVYTVVGAVFSAWMLGFANYTLEIAPPSLRPAYVGLSNTIAGLATVVPTLGGWILQISSYPALFGSAAAIGMLGFIATLGLKAPLPSDEMR